MAPSRDDPRLTPTTIGPRTNTYSVSDTISTDYSVSDTTISTDYTITYTIIYTITSRPDEIIIKKLLKKMADEMCKNGWIQHAIQYCPIIQLKPISLRGKRLDGRGWASSN